MGGNSVNVMDDGNEEHTIDATHDCQPQQLKLVDIDHTSRTSTPGLNCQNALGPWANNENLVPSDTNSRKDDIGICTGRLCAALQATLPALGENHDSRDVGRQSSL